MAIEIYIYNAAVNRTEGGGITHHKTLKRFALE